MEAGAQLGKKRQGVPSVHQKICRSVQEILSPSQPMR